MAFATPFKESSNYELLNVIYFQEYNENASDEDLSDDALAEACKTLYCKWN